MAVPAETPKKKPDKIYRVTDEATEEIAEVEFDIIEHNPHVVEDLPGGEFPEAGDDGKSLPSPTSMGGDGDYVKIPLETAVRDVAELIDFMKKEYPDMLYGLIEDGVDLFAILQGSRGEMEHPTIAKITAAFKKHVDELRDVPQEGE